MAAKASPAEVAVAVAVVTDRRRVDGRWRRVLPVVGHQAPTIRRRAR